MCRRVVPLFRKFREVFVKRSSKRLQQNRDGPMWLGKPTGSAMPLMWAHAEYIKLLRSTADGKVYEAIPDYVDLKDAPTKTGTCLCFTFLWTDDNRWEGRNYEVTVR